MSSNNSYVKNKEFLLIDYTITSSKINQLTKKHKQIISFDVKTDQILTEKKIKHEISDSFLDTSELLSIDSLCIKFCQWYNHNNGDKLLSFEGINLGSLFRVEFHNFLIVFLRNFIIISRIVKKYPEAKFSCSSIIFSIASKLSHNVNLIGKSSIHSQLTWDKIEYNLTSSISIKISKQSYQKFKKYSEILISILSKKNNKNFIKKSCALVEFDPIKYEKIFQQSTEFDGKIFLYNRHRPIAYNLNSLNIVRNSYVLPFITSKNKFKNIESDIDSQYNVAKKKFEKFMDDSVFFKSFFQYNDMSFWSCLKPHLIQIFNEKLLNSIMEIELAKIFLLDNKISSIIVLSESGFTEQIMLKLAKKFSIHTILLQHGVVVDNQQAIDYNKTIGGVLPVLTDKFFVWGKSFLNYAIQSGISSEKVEIKGSPNLDRFSGQKAKKSPNSILLLATGPRDQQSVGHDVNEWHKYEKLIQKICSIVTKHKQNLIIKRHPDMSESNLSNSISKKFPNVKILKHGNILDLLLRSKIVISVGLSSAIFEAQMLKKPVISIIVDHDVYGSPKNVSRLCLETTVDNFEINFSKLVTDSQFSQKIIRNGNEIMEKDLMNIGNSSKIILDSLDKS